MYLLIRVIAGICLAIGLCLRIPSVVATEPQPPSLTDCDGPPQAEIILIKVGGSSITNKAKKETLNEDALNWFASVLANEISCVYANQDYRTQACTMRDEEQTCTSNNNKAFVIVHGAGSFGHHTAKSYGLSGHTEPPPRNSNAETSRLFTEERRSLMHGLSETRLSVQELNQKVVATFVRHGMNAVAISPCFSIAGMQAHGGDDSIQDSVRAVVQSTLQAGLVPVLHGDACLYGNTAGILSGDSLMKMLGRASWTSSAVFLTDVDGVFTKDPKTAPNAQLLKAIQVDANGVIQSGTLQAEVSESLHEHDVTGGLKAKLSSAVSIAATGKNVTIARCASLSAERVIQGFADAPFSTSIFLQE